MPAPGGPLTAPPVVLLTLEFAGQTWRYATSPCDIVDRDGVSHHYDGGLPPLDVGEEIELFGVGEPASLSVELVPGAGRNPAALAALGHILTQATAEIALYRLGDTLERRLVMLDGRCLDPEIGAAGESMSFTIAGEPADDEASYPPASQVVDENTFPDGYDSANEGKTYPTVVGKPGSFRKAGVAALTAATPAYLVFLDWSAVYANAWAPAPGAGPTDFLLVAGHDCYAHAVHIYDVTAGTQDDLWAYHAVDGLGQDVMVVNDIPGAPPVVSFVAGHQYFAAWEETTGAYSIAAGIRSAGMWAATRADAYMAGAGEVLRWALEQSSVAVDWGRTGVAAQRLDAFRLAGFWDAACKPWEWVRDNLLPLLPVSIRLGPDGLYPVVWRHWASAQDAVFAFTDGLNCAFDGPVVEEGADETLSEVSLTFAFRAADSTYWLKRTWRGEDPETMATDSSNAHLRTAALTAYGEKRTLDLESDLVYDGPTADLILGWIACARAHPRRVVRLTADHRAGFVCAGDVVTLTSSARSLDGEVAHVRRAAWVAGRLAVEAVIFWRPTL